MWLAARAAADVGPEAFRKRMREAADMLRATRPTASNLAWALERMARALNGRSGVEAVGGRPA